MSVTYSNEICTSRNAAFRFIFFSNFYTSFLLEQGENWRTILFQNEK